MYNDLISFMHKERKARDTFYIKEIDKNTSYEFIRKYHYLGDAKFFCVKAFGLFYKQNDILMGCATYQLPQGVATLKSWFSLDNTTKNIFELGRLCMAPCLNNTNATSYLLSGSIKEMKKENNEIKDYLKKEGKEMTPNDYVCRCVITLALSSRHVGSIYQVCNFKYYGLTKQAHDFYTEDGKVNPRGKTKDIKGVNLPRVRKHRYAFTLDKTLKINYKEEPRPTIDSLTIQKCCNNTKIVYDKRFGVYYTCPICTGKLTRIDNDLLKGL